jgi:hypothetical protein
MPADPLGQNYLPNLVAIKGNLLATLAAETAYQAAYGPKPTYSLDGESYSWTEWRSAVLDKVEQLGKLIQLEQPFIITHRARA